MSNAAEILSTENVLFRAFIFYSSVLVLKMMFMSLLTSGQRFNRKVFANIEDVNRFNAVKVRTDDNVERVRRAHLNDLENIPIFLVASFAYILTNPPAAFALNLFRVFTLARCIHTFVYAMFVIPQPARALSWFTGYAITGYMALQAVLYFVNLK